MKNSAKSKEDTMSNRNDRIERSLFTWDSPMWQAHGIPSELPLLANYWLGWYWSTVDSWRKLKQRRRQRRRTRGKELLDEPFTHWEQFCNIEVWTVQSIGTAMCQRVFDRACVYLLSAEKKTPELRRWRRERNIQCSTRWKTRLCWFSRWQFLLLQRRRRRKSSVVRWQPAFLIEFHRFPHHSHCKQVSTLAWTQSMRVKGWN